VPPPAARIALAQGRVTATDTRGVVRDLETKSAVYVGDTVRTASDGYAFLVFRDEGRMTLAANSSFTIEQFRYEQARPEQKSIVVRLLQGGLRSLTGLIATRRPESFKLHTVVATIGVRGSGIDVRCGHLCVDPLRFAPDSRTFVRGQAGGATGEQGMPNAGGSTVPRVGDPIGTALTMSTEQRVEFTVSVWDGTATACPAAAGPAACRDVPKDQTAIIEKTDEPPKVVSNAPPLFDESAPRPDKPDVNMKDLFPEAKSDPGLYVYVREGKVVVSDSGKDVIAEAGEGIYADGRGGVPIPVLPPKSLQYDPWLLRTSNICR
jgi:hypothetical protein